MKVILRLSVLAVLLCASSIAQTSKLEVSANDSVLKVPFQHEHGIGVQGSYDFTRRFGFDSAVTFYLGDNRPSLAPAGNMFDFHGGLRFSVVRTRKFAIFARGRPGLIRLSDLRSVFEGHPLLGNFPAIPAYTVKYGPQTNLSLDFGGTVEIYPSPRTFIRLDFGDQYIRFREFIKEELVEGDPPVVYQVYMPAHGQHQYKMSFGAGWRFGAEQPQRAAESVVGSEDGHWTLALHYAALHIEPNTLSRYRGWRHGVGAELSRGLSRGLEWSTDVNFYPGMVNATSFTSIDQPILQFQSGAGLHFLRLRHFTFKANARPGFLRYSDYILYTASAAESKGTQYEFSFNYGVAAQMDFWKRFPLQLEFSDNLVRTAAVRNSFMFVNSQLVHAPQFTMGFGLRF